MLELPLAAVLFAAMWAISYRLKNYGFLDVTWTLGVGLLALVDGLALNGSPVRRAAITTVGLLWSLRLGLFILRRVLKHHPVEDKRYRSLRDRWKSPLEFLLFFELQAAIAVIFSLPFLVADADASPFVTALEIVGLGVALVGVLGESLADWQAQRFKSRADARKTVLDSGLWRHSRHPNYFFESLYWVGICLATVASPHGWMSIAAPVLILYFLFRVTGIPLTEKHALETHGEEYRDYQRRVSAFVPWFRRA
jgi:steroid 5-alpha reductase family enzyme